jgi:hypothetical protein
VIGFYCSAGVKGTAKTTNTDLFDNILFFPLLYRIRASNRLKKL